MEIQKISYQRVVKYSIPAAEALALREAGKTLAEIREALAPGVSLATVSRAIARAREAANVKAAD